MSVSRRALKPVETGTLVAGQKIRILWYILHSLMIIPNFNTILTCSLSESQPLLVVIERLLVGDFQSPMKKGRDRSL